MSDTIQETLKALSLSGVPLVVRVISFACLAIGVVTFSPFLFLIILDFFIWIWRICFVGRSASEIPHRERRISTTAATDNDKLPHEADD